MKNKIPVFFQCAAAVMVCAVMTGCLTSQGNMGPLPNAPVQEPDWIHNGEPIEFEGQKWYPQDGFDVLLDNEMVKLGDYRGVEFFADKVDVRPYNHLYTKFGRNKFRFFQKQTVHD